jgi:hypothetical protein
MKTINRVRKRDNSNIRGEQNSQVREGGNGNNNYSLVSLAKLYTDEQKYSGATILLITNMEYFLISVKGRMFPVRHILGHSPHNVERCSPQLLLHELQNQSTDLVGM